MSKKDYTKFSDKSKETENEKIVQNEELKVENVNDKHVVSPELEETVIEAGGEVTRVETEEGPNVEPAQNNEPEVKPALATLTGCAKLNVRKEPSKDSEAVCIVTKESVITVSMDESTEDFYKVYTSVNEVLYEGYCMKQFINIE